jgi:hypothetical protein
MIMFFKRLFSRSNLELKINDGGRAHAGFKGQAGDCVVAVALTGRVPTRVTGTVRKGDLMVSTGDGRAQANNAARVGTVIGKALADFDGADGTIEVVVGRV